MIAEHAAPASLTLGNPAGPGRRSRWRWLTRWRRPVSGQGPMSGPWVLVAILAVQAVLSLRLIWSNTAFGDEALYLWAGHLEWTHWEYGTPIPNFAAYFSGAPVLYPPLAALADSLAGLAGARILSLFFMLGATMLLYVTARGLFGNRQTALLACALFIGIGPTADLGAFATYDAMAIFLLALATSLAVRSGARAAEFLLVCAALSMALADGVKYASLLWNPVVIALAGLTAHGGMRQAVARAFRLMIYSAAAAVPALLVLGGPQYVQGLSFTTIDRQAADSPVSAAVVLADSADWVGVLFFLALIGVVVAAHAGGRRIRLTALVLAAAVVLAPLHQAQIHTLTSLYKHVVFGAWFGAMAAGAALAKASSVNEAKGWRIGVAAVVFIGFLGVGQASNMFAFWPDSARLVAAVRQALAASSGPGLMLAPNADGHVINYYLGAQAGANGVRDPDSATATAIRTMIDEGAFALVVADLPCRADPGECQVLRAVAATHRYRAAAVIGWSDHFGRGTFEILARTAG